MEHDRVERLISERMDGEHLGRRATEVLERHLEGCTACRAFESRAFAVREVVRFEPAPPVPDVVAAVMDRVAAERRPRRGTPRVRWRPPLAWRPRFVPVVAAALVGALTGSLVVAQPWRGDDRAGTALAASTVVERITAAAASIEGYEARYTIRERDPGSDIGRRELEMHVWFDAPERFRLDVVDLTSYPAPATPTDLRLIVSGPAWYLSAPSACPTATCPVRDVRVRNRAPFSSQAPMPTDVVLPLNALGDPAGLQVVGEGTVLGRDAVEVVLPFSRASSLFPFVSLGGRWRPFFDRDRVHVWLDRSAWFPLRWEVYPAEGAARDAWSLRFGIPREPATRRIFSVRATDVSLEAPPAGVFRVPEGAAVVRDQRAVATTLAGISGRVGFDPALPTASHGLDLYGVAVRETTGSSVVTYADGVGYLRIGESVASGSSPLAIGSHAEAIRLPDGVAYYEPSDAAHGRRLAIHTGERDLVLETNLTREALIEVAATIPVVGRPLPAEPGVERVTFAEAVRAAPFAVEVPPSTTLDSVELARLGSQVAVTLYLRDAAGQVPLRLHVEALDRLPPSAAVDRFDVDVAGTTGRWTPEEGRLEWVLQGVYRAIDGPGLSLDRALAIAGSLAR